MTPHFPFRFSDQLSRSKTSVRCKCYQTMPIQVFKLKVQKPASSSSALDREHGYSNSFTLCRGRTLYPHDMFRFDACAGPTRVHTILLMCRQANMTKLLHQPDPKYATWQSAGVSRLRTSDRVSYPDTNELLEHSGGSILSGQLT